MIKDEFLNWITILSCLGFTAGMLLKGANTSENPGGMMNVNSLMGTNDATYGQIGAGLGYYPKNQNWGIKGNIGYGSEKSNMPGLNYGATANWGPATFNINKGRHGIGGGFGVSLPIGGPSRRERQTGGMYGDNTLSAAGQGMAPQLGMSSTIVGQETDPALQEARLQGLAAAGQGLTEESLGLIGSTRQQEVIDRQRAEQEAVQAEQQYQQQAGVIEGTAGTIAQTTGQTLFPDEKGGLTNALATSQDVYQAQRAANLGSTLTQAGIAGEKGAQVANLASQSGTFPMSSAATGKTIIVDASGNVVNAGGNAVGAGLKSFATSGAGIGTIANLAGQLTSRLSDDDDPTHSNFGEYTGSVLQSAGTGATIGSFFPGPGTLIGAAIGAGYGYGKQRFGTKKAQKAEREYEAEATAARNKGIYDLNERVSGLYGSHMSNVAAGNLAQKTISGQNLGRNVMYRHGGPRGKGMGMMLGMPRYGYNS